MTIRTILRLAAALAALPPAVAAQTVYEIPRDLRWLGLHGDPAEYVRLVIAGERDPRKMFKMGCPSGGGWTGAVFDGMEAAAETNPLVRSRLAGVAAWGVEKCPDDRARMEAVVVDHVRRSHLEGGYYPGGSGMVRNLGWVRSHEARDVTRAIARDGDVWPIGRYVAAQTMIAHRMQDGLSEMEAERLVVLDLASAPAIGYEYSGHGQESTLVEDLWEARAVRRLVAEYGDAFRCEYERIVKEHRPPPEPVKLPPDVKRKKIGRALTREEAKRLGVTLPPGVGFHEPPPKPKPCPGAGGP